MKLLSIHNQNISMIFSVFEVINVIASPLIFLSGIDYYFPSRYCEGESYISETEKDSTDLYCFIISWFLIFCI